MDKPDVDFIEGLAGNLDRPEDGEPQPKVNGGDGHRDPRLPTAALRPDRDPALPPVRRDTARQTPQQIVDRVLELPEGTRFMVLAPVVRGRKGEYEALLADLARDGSQGARIDGEIHELTDEIKLDRYVQHTIEVVVDRLVRREGSSAVSPTRWRRRSTSPRVWPRWRWSTVPP